ncbi:MAG TPA: PaaI family thioesterase [Acidimicrobiales bacterium]|nr:PaaI family thioesterase [Acidimicrobiales bacterium]
MSNAEPVDTLTQPGSPRLRLAAALRLLINDAVAADLDNAVVTEAAEAVEAVHAKLAAAAGPVKRPRGQPDIASAAQDFFPTSPVMGLANPIAPPVIVSIVDGVDGGSREIRGEANFGFPYEGPPTCVHGGVIAETFDELLGACCIVSGNHGMTGTLTIRYRKPTPLRTDLRLEARYLRRDGRKIYAWAGIYHGDLLTAEADGLFIDVAPAQFVAIAEGNIDSADPVMLAAIRAEAAREGAASDVQVIDPSSLPKPG